MSVSECTALGLTKKQDHRYWMDILNIIATLCVVALHCNGSFWRFEDTLEWKSSVIIETLAYWAVPIFFMLSGANLINYRDRCDTKTYLKRRIKKTFIPYIVFTSIAVLLTTVRHFDDLSFSSILNIYLNGKAKVYWFFIPLFVAYAVIPLLGLLKWKKSISIGLIIVYSVIPFICKLANIEFNKSPNLGYLIYILLGYLLVYEIRLNKNQRLAIYSLGIIGLLVRAIFTYILSLQEGSVNTTFSGYLTPFTIAYSLAIFCFFKYEISKIVNRLSDNKKHFLRRIASMNFGVYLIHCYFTEYLPVILGFNNTSCLWRFGCPIIIYITCIIIVGIARKVPIIKNII